MVDIYKITNLDYLLYRLVLYSLRDDYFTWIS